MQDTETVLNVFACGQLYCGYADMSSATAKLRNHIWANINRSIRSNLHSGPLETALGFRGVFGWFAAELGRSWVAGWLACGVCTVQSAWHDESPGGSASGQRPACGHAVV